MKCRCGYEIKAYKSPAGWYLGTHDNEGYPQCRISGYAKTEEDAYNLPLIREFADENAFCNRNKGCISQEEIVKEISDFVGGYTCTNSLELADEILRKWGGSTHD